MGENGDATTTTGEVVYLLAEFRSEKRGPVHEIGSRARVLDCDGDRLTLAVACGSGEDIVTCARGLVARQRRSLASRRRFLRGRLHAGLAAIAGSIPFARNSVRARSLLSSSRAMPRNTASVFVN